MRLVGFESPSRYFTNQVNTRLREKFITNSLPNRIVYGGRLFTSFTFPLQTIVPDGNMRVAKGTAQPCPQNSQTIKVDR